MKEIDEKDLENAAGGHDYKTSNMYNTKSAPDEPACGAYSPGAFPADDLPDKPKPFTCGSCSFYNSSDGSCMCMLI